MSEYEVAGLLLNAASIAWVPFFLITWIRDTSQRVQDIEHFLCGFLAVSYWVWAITGVTHESRRENMLHFLIAAFMTTAFLVDHARRPPRKRRRKTLSRIREIGGRLRVVPVSNKAQP